MPGQSDNPRRSWECELVAVDHRVHGSNVTGATALGERSPEELERRDGPPRRCTRCRRLLIAAGAGGIGFMHEDGDAVLCSERLGEADVVAVTVGEYDATNVALGEAEAGELVTQISAVTGEAGVDQSDTIVADHEKEGDTVVSDAMNSGGKFHDGYVT